MLCSASLLTLACGPEPIIGDEIADASDSGEDPGDGDSGDGDGDSGDGDSGDGDGDSGDGDGDPGDGDGDPGDGDGDPGDGDGDGFGNGEDDCAGPEFPEQCDELEASLIEIVDVTHADGDAAWNPGEDLHVTVLFSTATIPVNYPALVSQTDHPQVTVPWINFNYFAALPDLEPLEHIVTFTADPTIEPGTEVTLKIAAATALGQITECDCPEVTTASWVESFVIE